MSIYRPTTRVMAVLELLQTHRQISGAELARRLEVDGRTLRRYIVMLEQLGIPITAERGRHGGYGLMAGFKLPPMIFNDEEALALSLGLLAAGKLGLVHAGPAIASAQAKLERVMPAHLEHRLRSVSETVVLDLPSPHALGDKEVISRLSDATQRRQRVSLRYFSAQQGATERKFDPYSLVYQNGSWYAIGQCHLRQDLRTFRLDRVGELVLLPQHFVRPDQFDAIAHLSHAIASIPRAFSIRVRLKSDLATIKAAMPDWMGILEADSEGVLLHSQAGDLDWFARQLASLPFEFEIGDSPALRDALKKCAKRLLTIART